MQRTLAMKIRTTLVLSLALLGMAACGGGDDVDDTAQPQVIAHRLVPVGHAGRGAVEQVRAMMQAVPLS